MTDSEVTMYLSEYDERGFEAIPAWLRHEIRARQLTFPRRDPTPQEMDETIRDAREHRIVNNEKTLEDYIDKYKHGKSFDIL